jgi:hypothetical protein
MARRLARIRNDVLDRARAAAMTALGLDSREFESLMGLLMSALDLTLRGELGA